MRVLPESNFGKHPERYFTGDEYVLADPGYTSRKHLLAVKKKPNNRDMPPDDEKFNQYIAMMRIKIEHAFGILKGRFQSLRKIPIEIRNVDDLWFVNAWIRTCVVLHNLLLDQHDDEATIIMKELWDQVELLGIEDIQNDKADLDEELTFQKRKKLKSKLSTDPTFRSMYSTSHRIQVIIPAIMHFAAEE